MTKVFVDTNVFLVFFTKDDLQQHLKSKALFERAAQGKIELITGPPVLFEMVWTLRGSYGIPREQVLEVLSSLVNWVGLSFSDAKCVRAAMSLAQQTGQEFADAYIAALANETGADQIATFNRKDFTRLGARIYSV